MKEARIIIDVDMDGKTIKLTEDGGFGPTDLISLLAMTITNVSHAIVVETEANADMQPVYVGGDAPRIESIDSTAQPLAI